MNRTNKEQIMPNQKKRLYYISTMLRELRLLHGKNQDGFIENGVSRRQIQRAEYGNNISLTKLFSILDCFGYTLSDIDYKEL